MKLPEIGDIITTPKALKLCTHFGLDYLIDRINTNPDNYKDWSFDGCSGLHAVYPMTYAMGMVR
jgi:hypothetical protein